jgi:hypothetical protein
MKKLVRLTAQMLRGKESQLEGVLVLGGGDIGALFVNDYVNDCEKFIIEP